jgi:hypothetical protein
LKAIRKLHAKLARRLNQCWADALRARKEYQTAKDHTLIFEILTNTYFEDTEISLKDGNQLAVHPLEEKKSILGHHEIFKIVVLYYLRQRIVNFEDATTELFKYYERNNENYGVKIDAKWIVIGSGAGIYLFDELKSNKKSKGIKNHICTIDTDNGKTFFNPGSEKNDHLSILVEDLFIRANSLSKEEFAIMFINILDKLIPLIND